MTRKVKKIAVISTRRRNYVQNYRLLYLHYSIKNVQQNRLMYKMSVTNLLQIEVMEFDPKLLTA